MKVVLVIDHKRNLGENDDKLRKYEFKLLNCLFL